MPVINSVVVNKYWFNLDSSQETLVRDSTVVNREGYVRVFGGDIAWGEEKVRIVEMSREEGEGGDIKCLQGDFVLPDRIMRG